MLAIRVLEVVVLAMIQDEFGVDLYTEHARSTDVMRRTRQQVAVHLRCPEIWMREPEVVHLANVTPSISLVCS